MPEPDPVWPAELESSVEVRPQPTSQSVRIDRGSEDSGFEKIESGNVSEDPGFDDRNYRDVGLRFSGICDE